MSTAASVASSVLSLMLNGVPIQASYLESKEAPCEAAKQAAAKWTTQGFLVAESEVAGWCTAGTVIDGTWIAEQWRRVRPATLSQGWRLAIPLAGSQARGRLTGIKSGLEIVDLDVKAQISVQRSPSDPVSHHRKSLAAAGEKNLRGFSGTSPIGEEGSTHLISRVGRHGLIVTGAESGVGSYSVVIKRNPTP